MGIKKPLICQAGSAEAFLDSAATGREHYKYIYIIGFVKGYLEAKVFTRTPEAQLSSNRRGQAFLYIFDELAHK